MKTRTCPHCGYKYSIKDYVSRLLFKLLWSNWTCKNCNNLITFNVKRRLIIALTFGLWFIILSFVKELLNMTPIKWITLLIIFLAGSILIFTFDSFDRSEKTLNKK